MPDATVTNLPAYKADKAAHFLADWNSLIYQTAAEREMSDEERGAFRRLLEAFPGSRVRPREPS